MLAPAATLLAHLTAWALSDRLMLHKYRIPYSFNPITRKIIRWQEHQHQQLLQQ